MPFKQNEIAYAAGLFEGEGTINVARYYYNKNKEKKLRKTPQIEVRIAMTDKEPLDNMKEFFGGYILGPYQYKKGKNSKEFYKKFWIWTLDSPPVVKEFLDSVSDYLSPRRLEQIEVAYAV